MRTRIAQDAARLSAASVQKSTKSTTASTRSIVRGRTPASFRLVGVLLGTGVALIAAAVIAAASLGATTAAAAHRSHRAQRRLSVHLAADEHTRVVQERVLLGMRWLTTWRAARTVAVPTPPPPPPPPPPPAPAPVLTDANSTTTPDWACIRLHESGDRFNSPTAPGGAYGFLEMTWLSLGYSGWPYQASPAVQSQAALFLYNELGWQPWSTRFVCGL